MYMEQVLQWSCDESYCARLLPDGNLVILAGGGKSTRA